MKIIRNSKKGMEIVQVAILIAIAIALGIVFKDQIVDFVNDTFEKLNDSRFNDDLLNLERQHHCGSGGDNAPCDTCRNVTFLYTDKPL